MGTYEQEAVVLYKLIASIIAPFGVALFIVIVGSVMGYDSERITNLFTGSMVLLVYFEVWSLRYGR